jgi:RHS repeat-associated protein
MMLFVLRIAGMVGKLNAQTVEYIHTDALGSIVAITDEHRNVIERREYEPYGAQLTPALRDGPGYTGHLQDAATGLVQMQQRYYDPQIGRFLSVDPVTAYGSGDMRQFNRYAYAINNPYKYIDPDGRAVQALWGAPIGASVNVAVQMATANGSFGERFSQISWGQVGVATAAGALSGGVSAIANTATSTSVAISANVIGNAAVGAAATQAGAHVEGRTASVSEVLTGAVLSGGASGLGQVVSAAPAALAKGASSGMTQTQRTATENLLGGIKEATPNFSHSNPVQTTANAGAGAINASAGLEPLIKRNHEK